MSHALLQERGASQIGQGKALVFGFRRQPRHAETGDERDRQQGNKHQKAGHEALSFGMHSGEPPCSTARTRIVGIGESSWDFTRGTANRAASLNRTSLVMHRACQGPTFSQEPMEL